MLLVATDIDKLFAFFLGLSASVAVQNVVNKLEPALEDELEFLKLFKEVTGNDNRGLKFLPMDECQPGGATGSSIPAGRQASSRTAAMQQLL